MPDLQRDNQQSEFTKEEIREFFVKLAKLMKRLDEDRKKQSE